MHDDKAIEAAAQAAHEINRAYCREVMGDNSHLQWKDVPAWQREPTIEGVRAIARDPRLTSADLHARWREHKLAEGWMYGPKKNAELKIHPCLVSFSQLPLQERVKDALFGLVVRAVLGLEHNVAIDTAIENIRGGQLGQ